MDTQTRQTLGTGAEAIARIASNHGFIERLDLAALAADPATRLRPVLVRCGACRFTAPADQAQHLIDIIARDGADYVRDVSLPATDPMYTGRRT
jgi:hypothetical protein